MSQERPKSSSPSRPSRGAFGNDRACFNCGEAGHMKDQCPKPFGYLKTCRACGEQGHMSNNCPKNSRNVKCYNCGKDGHMKDQCPDKRGGHRDDYNDRRRGDRYDDRHDDRGYGSRRGDDRGSRRYDDRHGRREWDNDENDAPAINENFCVRIGVENPRRSLSREQVIDEVDQVRLAHRVVHIKIERPEDNFEWARIYFKTAEDADDCITELNVPLRQSKWRNMVSQRLPLAGPFSGEIGTIPAFQALEVTPADTIAVDTQEGFVHFSTDELYRSGGSNEYLTARAAGKTIRRLICKHFDPEAKISCRYGAECQFVHIKAFAMNRLLRTTHHRAGLRASRDNEDIQVSLWEFARRRDTLLIRNLDKDLDEAGLKYMFETCPGFTQSFLRRKDHQSYGIIRFSDEKAAMLALLQTYGSNLNIAFFGPMEDIRTMQLHEAREKGSLTNANRSFFRDNNNTFPRSNTGNNGENSSSAVPATPADKGNSSSGNTPADRKTPSGAAAVPNFPALPEGWSHGHSRRTGQFFFYHKNEKNKTTWKHPETQQTYKA